MSDPYICPKCGDLLDFANDYCVACGYFPEHEHAAPTEADEGGAMDSRCWWCNTPIYRNSYGSFVGPWIEAKAEAIALLEGVR